MDHKTILDTAWLFLKFVHQEWHLRIPGIPSFETTPAQVELYREIKHKFAFRREKTLRLAELQKRLDLLRIYEDTPGAEDVIQAYKKTIETFRRSQK